MKIESIVNDKAAMYMLKNAAVFWVNLGNFNEAGKTFTIYYDKLRKKKTK